MAARFRLDGQRWGRQGGATLVGLALAGFVLMAGLVAVDVGALAGARAAAQTAADLAALAALSPQTGPVAGSAQRWGEAQAAGIAAANGAELVACDCSAVQAVVRVRRRLAARTRWPEPCRSAPVPAPCSPDRRPVELPFGQSTC